MARFEARAFVFLAVGSLAAFGGGRTAHAGTVPVSFTLGNPVVTASSAVFDVTLNFGGSSGDNLFGIQMSVVGSDPLLTKSATDYSRFSFQLDTANLPAGWSELAPIGVTTGFDLIAPNDPINGPFITPVSNLLFGKLTVSLTGIAPGTSLFATIAGGTPGIDSTDASGMIGVTEFDSLATAGLLIASPPQVRFQTPGQVIPEPASLALAVPPMLLAVALAIRRRASSRMHRAHKKVTGKPTY
jgi:hypothetical protein